MKYVMKGAVISDCQRYRYRLWRYWDIELPPMCFIMLNPSTADGEQDDATIRKCVGFADRHASGGIEIVNLFAWRSRDPDQLLARDPAVLVGPLNDSVIVGTAKATQGKGGDVILAWGAHPGARANARDLAVLEALHQADIHPRTLGRSKAGHPRHPLMLSYETPIKCFDLLETLMEKMV